MSGTVEVTTADGVVRGLRGRSVLRWRSIPYAAPPVGDLRFRAPHPPCPWDGVRDATEFGFAAMQHKDGPRLGVRRYQATDEDALTLNVTAPVAESPAPRPVMVFIHGGGYLTGSSAVPLYSGARLAVRGDVVVVSMNYRLGAFGYVDFGEFGSPERAFESNLGLRDQIAALKWVRANIAAFGGDPGNVTVFGESAGANAVLALLASPAAEGLFHRAIAQSPPAGWALTPEEARAFARRCVDALGVAPSEATDALINLPANEIRRAVARVFDAGADEWPGVFPICPVVDGELLPLAPVDAMAAGVAHPLPLIIGTNRDEGTLFDGAAGKLPTNEPRLRKILGEVSAETRARVLDAYPGFPDRKVAVRMGGDYVFWRPTVAAMEAHSRHAPTYAYRYDFAPRLLHLTGYGVTHASELVPVFGYVDGPIGRTLTALGGGPALRAVSHQFQDNWLSFARTGTPLPTWPVYTEDSRTTLIIDAHTHLESDPDHPQRLAWSGFRTPTLT